MNGQVLPKDKKIDVQLTTGNYGLNLRISTYDKMAIVYLSGQVNANVAQWDTLATVPRAREQVLAPDISHPGHYIIVNYDGRLVNEIAYSSGDWVNMTAVYFLDDSQSN